MMAAWIYSINIKQYLNRADVDGVEDDIITAAENVAKELKTVPVFVFGTLPDQLVKLTREAIEKDDPDYAEYQFNRILSRVYDRADEYRVWLGLR